MRIAHSPETGKWQLWIDGEETRWFDTEQEARMSTTDTALQEYDRRYLEIRDLARRLIKDIRDMGDHIDANPQILAAIDATEAGQLVAGGTMPREAYLTANALLTSLQSYLDSPLIPATESTPAISHKAAVYRMG